MKFARRFITVLFLIFLLTVLYGMPYKNAASPEIPVIYVDPNLSIAGVGEYFTIDIKVADITGLLGWEVYLNWSKALVTIASYTLGGWTYYNITEGPFLKGPFYHESRPMVSQSEAVTVTDPKKAYDNDEDTFGYFGYGTTGHWNLSAFSIGDRKAGDIIDQVDLKIKYSAEAAVDDQYRIYYAVSPDTAPQVLQDWTSAATALNTYTWANIAEPNDFSWSWEDVSGTTLFFESQMAKKDDGAKVYVYEVWLSIKYHHTTIFVSNTENVESEGWVMFGSTMMGDVTLLSGNGTLGSVIFEVLGEGECDLHLYDTLLLDASVPEPQNIPHTTQDGHFSSTLAVSAAQERIIDADANSVYFIFADPAYMTRPEATYDVASGEIVYALCINVQNQGWNTTDDWLLDTGAINSAVINGSTVAMFGGPFPHVSVRYYENAGLTPAKTTWNSTHFMFVNQTDDIVAALSISTVRAEHEDMFLMEVFMDGDNTFFIMYGFDYLGTWGAGIYFDDVVSKNLGSYTDSCYIYHWIDDAGQDGVPQSSEISLIDSFS